jgi:exodeoxyribonuclease VII small subunit
VTPAKKLGWRNRNDLGIALVATRDAFDIASANPLSLTFESNLARLDEIVSELEGGRLELARALALFEEGVELLRLASGELNETESRVKELIERADGVLELRDLRS